MKKRTLEKKTGRAAWELLITVGLGLPGALLVFIGLSVCGKAHGSTLVGPGMVVSGFLFLAGMAYYYYRTDYKETEGWSGLAFIIGSCACSILLSQFFLKLFLGR